MPILWDIQETNRDSFVSVIIAIYTITVILVLNSYSLYQLSDAILCMLYLLLGRYMNKNDYHYYY